MASHAWNDLPYGHFGDARYDPEEGAWSFVRSPGRTSALTALCGIQTFVPSPERPDTKSSHRYEIPSKRHERQIKEVTRRLPELQPASTLLRPLLQASEAVEEAAARHDPVKGSRLAFGRIFDESLRRHAQVAAFASGYSGSDLRIVQVQLQKQGWEDSKDIWIEVPVLAGEEVVWPSEGSPIQQVCFAKPVENGESLLAVRLITRTVIFKPVLRKSGPGKLRANELCEIRMSETGNVPHADVAFNPWFTRQFALVDQAGNWSIWEFDNREARDAKCMHRWNSTSEGNDTNSHLNDGWARVSWVYDPNTILLLTRYTAALYDIASGPQKLQDLDFGISEGAGWILDVSSLAGHANKICILTTTYLHVMSIAENDGAASARMDLRVRHYRSPEDITLNIAMHEDGEDFLVMLRSALSPAKVIYRLILDDAGAVHLHDPSDFLNASPTDNDLDMHSPVDVAVQDCAFVQRRNAHVDHTRAATLRDNDRRITSHITLTRDLSVYQQLYCSASVSSAWRVLDFPAWKGRLPGTSATLGDSFVVDDDDVDVPQTSSKQPMSDFMSQRLSRNAARSGAEWTLNFELAADQIEHRNTEAEDFTDVLEAAREVLERPWEESERHMRLLNDLGEGEHTTSDVDRASTAVKELTLIEPREPAAASQPADETTEHDVRFVLRPVASASVLGLPSAGGEPNLAATYDGIVLRWISTLSDRVPARVRMVKEVLARRMAAELTLASNALRLDDVEPSQATQDSSHAPSQSQGQSQSQSWSLPMRTANLSQASQSLSLPVLPTPSPTATPSLITNSSRTSLLGPAPEVSRLSKYTTFTKPVPPSLPRPLAKVFAHWQPGTDPDTYDWITTSRSINREVEAEEADSQLTEKERARLARKAERMLKRQRKENAASQQQMAASSQMPELVVSASQPPQRSERRGAVPASSQSVGMSMGTASQGVPGRFGGRPPAKKQKRKQGF